MNVRRTMTMIETSLRQGLRSLLRAPHVPATWNTARAMVTDWLYQLWKAGGLAGSTPDEACFVQVGRDATMTAEDIDAGRLIIVVGAAIMRPAQFHNIRLVLQLSA